MAVRFLRIRQVRDRVPVAISTIYRQMELGEFPRPIRLGPGAVGWVEAEIEAWAEAQIKKARPPVAA